METENLKSMEAQEALNETNTDVLEAFFRIHDYLVDHSFMPIRRLLMDEINWEDRLIAIKGGRGVGKTDFMLSRAKEIEQEWKNMPPVETKSRKRGVDPSHIRPCLYISLNDFFFTKNTIIDVAGKFVKAGGRYLFLDQIFKYTNWSKELRKCYHKYKELHICATPVMPIDEENPDLVGIVHT